METKLSREEKIFILKIIQAGKVNEGELLKAVPALTTPIIKHVYTDEQGEACDNQEEQQGKNTDGVLRLTKGQKRFLVGQLSKGSIDTEEVCGVLNIKANVIAIRHIKTGFEPASSEEEVRRRDNIQDY